MNLFKFHNTYVYIIHFDYLMYLYHVCLYIFFQDALKIPAPFNIILYYTYTKIGLFNIIPYQLSRLLNNHFYKRS